MSRTWYEYDGYSSYPLRDCPNIVQHDSGYPTGYQRRGNLTKVIQFAAINPQPQNIYLHNQYDIAGNLVKAVDGKGNATEFFYDDKFGAPDGSTSDVFNPSELGGQKTFAFVTSVKNALNHTTFTQYDYYLGRPVDIADANGLVTKVDYKDLLGVPDPLDRPTQVVRGANLPTTYRERNRTLYTYNDSARLITTKRDLNNFGDGLLKSESLYDGLGRTTETRQYETTTSYITSKVTYDALGRVEFSYNPRRTTTEETYGWTKTTYDALSRVIGVGSFDKNGNSTGAVQTAYSGNRVLVTDQAGKQRISQTNALGQLAEVWEIKLPDTATENISFPDHPEVTAGYRTTYAYNALDSLTTVTQRVGASGTTQTRSFEYDSLKRLTRAINPESGSTWYTYDNNGNLIEKTDQMGRIIDYEYDALNRLTFKSGSTPMVEYYYDNQTLPSQPAGFNRGSAIGRLVAVTSQSSLGGPVFPPPLISFYSYDAAGRVKNSYQRLDGADYGFTNIVYNRADAATVVNYPSGRSVITSYDGAGRIASMYTTTGVATVNLSSSISYSPAGALTSELYGNGLLHSITYNSRFQPTSISLGYEENPDSNFRLAYLYGQLNNLTDPDSMIDTGKNNGNIARTRLFWDDTQSYAQTYRYDHLNRIQDYVLHLDGIHDTEHEFGKDVYEYDRFGNRGVNNSVSSNWGPPLSYFNPANNRINISPYTYSSVGNLTRVPIAGSSQTMSYTYNAENKLVTAGGVNYDYNGDGQRVKITGHPATTRKMVYNAGGQLIAEYGSSGSLIKEYFYRGGELLATIDADGTVKFGTPDHLGSVREWTYLDGSWVPDGTHDYTPFGLDLHPGGQTDGQRQQFGSKERDTETGLDYFLARYYSSTQGRFTSPDEFTGGPTELFAEVAAHNPTFYAEIAEPQSLNKYAYCLNNPLKFVDPDGHQSLFADHINRNIEVAATAIGKSVGNGIAAINNEGNKLLRAVGFEVSDWGYFQPSSPREARIMETTDKLLFISGAAGKRGPANVAVAEGEGAAVVASGASKLSPKVQNIIKEIDKQGIKVTVNPKNSNTLQEGNVTLHSGKTQVNLRVETHPLKPNGPPVRHANVEVTQRIKNKNKVVENKHIE